jgi:hypothetical protein
MKLPGTLAVASNWTLLKAAPYWIGAGVFQVMVGALEVAAVMVRESCCVMGLYSGVSDGVNVAVSCCVPAGRTVPSAGLYESVPGTFAAAFNCAAPRAVPC